MPFIGITKKGFSIFLAFCGLSLDSWFSLYAKASSANLLNLFVDMGGGFLSVSGIGRRVVNIRILVSGGTRLIGTELVQALISQGHQITILSRRATKELTTIQGVT